MHTVGWLSSEVWLTSIGEGVDGGLQKRNAVSERAATIPNTYGIFGCFVALVPTLSSVVSDSR